MRILRRLLRRLSQDTSCWLQIHAQLSLESGDPALANVCFVTRSLWEQLLRDRRGEKLICPQDDVVWASFMELEAPSPSKSRDRGEHPLNSQIRPNLTVDPLTCLGAHRWMWT